MFRTEDLTLACYLYATRRLNFVRCEAVPGRSRVTFIFDDPESTGEAIADEVLHGARCSAVSLFDSLHHLRKVMRLAERSRYDGTFPAEAVQ